MKSILIPIIGAILLTSSPLFGATIVNFNTLNGTGSVSESTPLNLTTPGITSSDFSTAPPSPTVYSGVDASGRYVFIDRGEGTVLEIGPSNQNNLVAGYLWKKEDFLNGGDAQQVDLESASNFSVDFATRSTSNGQISMHWMFLQDGTLYVSDNGESAGSTSLSTVESDDLTAMNWSSVALTTDVHADPVSATPSFLDVEGVGVYFTSDFASGGDDADARGFWFQDFSADATVVPEPGSGMLMLFGLTILLGLSSRRRRVVA